MYSVGFEHAFGSPEVVVSGFGRQHMSRMLQTAADHFNAGGVVTEGTEVGRIEDEIIELRYVHEEWLRTDLMAGANWFNRGLRRAAQLIEFSPGFPPWPEQPHLWLPPSAQAIAGWREFNIADDADWRHPVAWDTPFLIPKSISEHGEWISAVLRGRDDEWQVADEVEHIAADLELVPLSYVLELDPSVADVLDMALGEYASRAAPLDEWQRTSAADAGL